MEDQGEGVVTQEFIDALIPFYKEKVGTLHRRYALLAMSYDIATFAQFSCRFNACSKPFLTSCLSPFLRRQKRSISVVIFMVRYVLLYVRTTASSMTC